MREGRRKWGLFLSVEDAGRRSERSGSIYSSPRLFSFRRTFRVQQQSCRDAATSDGLCSGNDCVLSHGRSLLSSLLIKLMRRVVFTHAHTRTHAGRRKLSIPPCWRTMSTYPQVVWFRLVYAGFMPSVLSAETRKGVAWVEWEGVGCSLDSGLYWGRQ